MLSELVLVLAIGLLLCVWLLVNNNRINRTFTTSKNRVIDSDSDDEGGLFGKPSPPLPQQQQQQQQQQPSLFGGPQLLPKSRGSSEGKDAAGVENIRAMPDPSHSLPTPSTKNQKPGINLFASDSDDEGDLFSSRTPVSGKARSQSGRVQVESQQNTRTSGLFSSDDDAPLFSSAPPNNADDDQENESEAREEPQLLSTSSGKKFQVPVGGVNIFGSAITSAIRRKQSSDSELSDDEGSNRGSVEASSTSSHKVEPPLSAHTPSFKESESIKKSGNIKGNSQSLGLFDDDDDEEDLFSSAIKIPASTTTTTTYKINEPKSTPSFVKAPEEAKSLIKSKIAENSAFGKSETASTGKLFSDDDDDLFGISKKQDLAEVLPKPNTVIKEKENNVLITPRPADLPLPSENVQKPSHPVKIPDPPKAKKSSLFNSPSDDDDLFSTPKVTMGSTKPSSAFVTEPPPFEQESDINKTNKSQQDDLFSPATFKSQTGNIQEPSKCVKIKTGKVDDKLQPPPTGRLFSSPSDEDELFSAVPKTNEAHQSQEKLSSIKSLATYPENSDTAVDPSTSTNLEKDESQSSIFDSPEDDIFKSKSFKSGAKSSLFASNLDDDSDIFSDIVSKSMSDNKSLMNTKKKISNIFETVNDDDDIFAVTQKETKPRESLTQKEVTTETTSKLSSKVQTETTKPIDERTQFSAVAEGKNDPTSMDTTKEVTSVIQPKQPVGKFKKPAGGVALFGGSELADQINKRNSLINSGGVSDEESQKERNQPLQGEKLFKSEEKKGSSMSDIFGGESGDDNLFGSSSLKAEKSPSLFYPKIPPHVSITTDTLSASQPSKPETLSQEPKAEEIKKEGDVKSHTRELGNEPAVISKNVSLETKVKTIDLEEKETKNGEISEERKEIKPTKKPPIGGVLMFGGGGIGGKELLARVQQRKSMMSSESESEEEPTTPAAPHPPSSLLLEENSTLPSPVSPSSLSPSSPVFLIPVFPSSPTNKTVFKSGGEESNISFDDPVSTSTTLESLNKRRARGSQKRRPPSRAHRKSGINDQDPSDTITTIMNKDSDTTSKRTPTNLMPENVSHSAATAAAAAGEPWLSSTAAEGEKPAAMKDRGALSELSADEQKVNSILINNTDHKVGAVIVNKDSNPDKSNLKSAMAGENKKDAIKDNESVLITKSISALHTSKQDTVSKSAGASLFDGSDSDEDLFGKKKQKSAPVKVSEVSAPNTTTELPGKSAKTQSLFGDEDDDDDIFSSGARVGNTPVVPPQKSSATMPKNNLVTSSEPFEDPLLGSLK